MEIASGMEDCVDIGRGDSQKGMGDGAYLGETGIGSGGGEGE